MTESKLNGVSTTYTYDKVGNVLSTTMANGTQTVKYAYDQLNRPVKYTDALGKSETYKYNNYGDMTSKVDRNGVTTNYTYDGLHRLTSEKAVKNGVTSAKYFTYALTGQLVWESNGSLAKSYSYAKDNLGKIYSDESYTLNGLNYRTRRLYNIADMNNYVQTFRSDVSYSIYTLNYSFDSKGRLYMFSSQSASEYSVGSKYDIYYTYDKNDNIKTGKTRGGVTTEYSYNDANMLTSLVNKKGTTTYSTYSYNYNLDGNINRKVESGNTTDYIYDGTGRLSNEKITNGSAVTNMTYGYDNAGNRSSLTVTGTENYVTTYSYDKNNRLLKDSKKNNGASYADVTLYSYDNNGNQIRKDQSRDDLTDKPKMGLSLATVNSGYGYEKFTYNGFNQLTAFEDEAGNKATYEYYSDGLRLSKTVNGAKSSYIWTDNNLSMEIKSDEVISYAKAPGYMRTGSSKDSLYRNDKLYLFNGHGDVTSMVDKSGKVTKTYSYDAFGNEINRDKNDTNPFRYCGEYWDNETESIYLRARYYNPSIGRFTTEDPIKDGSNWYAYCEGNPVSRVDSTGQSWVSNRLSNTWEKTKGAFKIVGGYVDEKQKFAQREFWKTGSQIILRDNYGYETSAWMLEHSLDDNPSDVYRGNDSRIAYLINNDSEYLNKLDDAIKKSYNGKINQDLKDICFKNGDLYYSIHNATIHVEGYKQKDGSWIINAKMTDTYDFTEIQSFMDDKGNWSKEASLGTVANDIAVISQMSGAITPYNITVNFQTYRRI